MKSYLIFTMTLFFSFCCEQSISLFENFIFLLTRWFIVTNEPLYSKILHFSGIMPSLALSLSFTFVCKVIVLFYVFVSSNVFNTILCTQELVRFHISQCCGQNGCETRFDTRCEKILISHTRHLHFYLHIFQLAGKRIRYYTRTL